MLAVSLRENQLPALEGLFRRAPDVPALLAYHLGFTSLLRSSHSTYVRQITEQLRRCFNRGEHLVFLLHHEKQDDQYLIPICGFVQPSQGSWRVRVSIWNDPRANTEAYFEVWLQKMDMYARRSGAVHSIHLLTDDCLLQ